MVYQIFGCQNFLAKYLFTFLYCREKCGEGSLIDLVSDAKKYGIPAVKCNDNPV